MNIGTAEFGNGTTTIHQQIAATELRTTVDRITIVQSDTDAGGYDTGAFGSTGTVVAGKALLIACERLRERILTRAVRSSGRGAQIDDLSPDGVETSHAASISRRYSKVARSPLTVATTGHRARSRSTFTVFALPSTRTPAG